MVVSVSLDEFDTADEAIKMGSGRPDPGRYHCQVTDVEEKDNYAEVKWEVVGPGDQQTKTFRDSIWFASSDGDPKKEANISKRLIRYAINTRMATREEFAAAKAAGQNLDLDFVNRLPGCQAIVEVKSRTWKDKKTGEDREGIEVPFWGIYDLADETVADVPLNEEMAAMLGVTRRAAPAANQKLATNGKTAPPKAAATTAAARQKINPRQQAASPAPAPQAAAVSAAASAPSSSIYDDV